MRQITFNARNELVFVEATDACGSLFEIWTQVTGFRTVLDRGNAKLEL